MTTRLFRIVFAVAWACVVLCGCGRERGGDWVETPSRGGSSGSIYVFTDDELQGVARTPAGCAHTAAFGFVQVPLAAALVLALIWAEAHRRRSRVERGFDAKAPVSNGPSVLFGVVEHEEGANGPFVSVAIHQEGREWCNKGQWRHAWRETNREVRSRAFFVRRDDGARVRVEPDDDVVLHDDLSTIDRKEAALRTRLAELMPGEHVHIVGTIHGAGRASPGAAYRASPVTPVMRRPRNGRMVISTEAPGDTEAKRTRFHRWWAAGLCVAFAASVALLLQFDALVFDGRVVVGPPVATRFWEVYVKPKNSPGYWEPRYAVRVRVSSSDDAAESGPSLLLEDDCSHAAYQCATRGDCELPFIFATHAPGFAQIGSRPVLTLAEFILGLTLSILSIAIYASAAFSTRPWYLKRRVVDAAVGRL